MTGSLTVTIAKRSNVLVVPTSAVSGSVLVVVRARDDERQAGLPSGHDRHGDLVAHPDHERAHGR